MALKKSQLYAFLWQSCDELRGGMDASQYKDYVLFMLFIKYISDKYADYDGFEPPVIIPEGAGFKDMLRLRGRDDIGDRINTRVIQPLIDSNPRLGRSDFPDFNDPNKLGEGRALVDRLTNLINIFNSSALDFSRNRADHDDILGDAYEYLMRHFAQESGKSKGQFYTPSEVSRIMARVIGVDSRTVTASTTAHDPTCGSGSLLLKVAAEAGNRLTLEGQDKDVTNAGLARMNMILHDFPTATILNGNTLAAPKFREGEGLRTYDFVVANPPFSDKTWRTGLIPEEDPYERFTWGVPPAKQGDYAYLLHIVRVMKSTGKAACILPHGVLFRGNAEARIRKNLVCSGILKGIIGLPPNLFYGTGIPACILVLDKETASERSGIFMIDAARGFMKDGNKNRLREQDIYRIVDTFRTRTEIPRYARMVPFDEISDPRNDYNLNLPRYIDSTEPEDIQDITGHLRGGIPGQDIDALDSFWQVFPAVREELFEPAAWPGYFRLIPPADRIKSTILYHPEFTAFKQTAMGLFDRWRAAAEPLMKGFDRDSIPKDLIETVSRGLLAAFKAAPLLDPYAIYQHLMDLWAETMQDDCYLIAADGWRAEPRRIREEVTSGRNKGTFRDRGWTCDLVPKSFIVARYFAAEQGAIDNCRAQLEQTGARMEELKEEHGTEGSILHNVTTKADAREAVTAALMAAWAEADPAGEDRYTALMDEVQAAEARLQALTDHPAITAVKNRSGNLPLAAVRKRLATTTDPRERQVLQDWLDADQGRKQKAGQAAALLKKAEKHFRKALLADPLPETLAELHAAVTFLAQLEEQTRLRGRIRSLETELDDQAYRKYPELSQAEIQTLVVEDKWLAGLTETIHTEIDQVSQHLAGRIRQLADRYDTPLTEIETQVTELSGRVAGHLKKMGVEWE